MEKKKNIDRRKFLQVLGAGAAASATIYGCSLNSKSGDSASSHHEIGNVPTDKMSYRTNPNSGDKVSLLGYGCMRLPEKPVAGNSEKQEIDQDAVNDLVDYAIAHGINYFDTSPVYCEGLSEHAMGIALSRHPRNKYFIATKMSNFDPATRSLEESVAMYHNSMKELKVDYLDYYLLHAVGSSLDDFEDRFIKNGMLDYLLKERAAGRIRNLGWSFHGIQPVFDYVLAMDVKWDFIQIQLNYSDWQHATERNVNAEYLYNQLVEHKVPAVIMEPLLGGRLAKLNDLASAKLKQKDPQASVASWAFRYAGSPDNVLTVLSGMTYKEQMQENICTYSPLTAVSNQDKELLDEVTKLILQYPTVPCTGCKYCMPCPYGIDIPAVFTHYNKCVNEGNVVKSLQDPQYSHARQVFLVGYDRSVPKLRQASHCIGCGHCVPACPQGIRIPREMRKIDEFAEALKQGKPLEEKKKV